MSENRNRPGTTEDSGGPQAVSGFYVVLPPAEGSAGVTVADVMKRLRARVLWLMIGAASGLALGITLFVAMRPLYRAEVLAMTAVRDDQGALLSRLAGQFGGLAQLGGIELPNAANQVDEAVAVMRSREFVSKYIDEKNLMPVLFADKWDAENDRWKGESTSQHPTLQKGIAKWSKSVMHVEVDTRTEFVSVIIYWYDRSLAATWANDIVSQLNATIRERAIAEARQNIEYLNRELATTEVVGLREGLFRLIEAENRRAMLANTRDEYALRVIDPALVPDEDRYVRPRLGLYGVTGILVGLLIAVGLVIAFHKETNRAQ